MKISVITATFNSVRTIQECIESVMGQFPCDVEHVIVDGGSTDGTIDIIREYWERFPHRIRWISEKDNGIYDAFNKGIALATGDIAGFLGSDDVLTGNLVLGKIAAAFMDDADLMCTYGDLVFVSATDRTTVKRRWKGSQYHDGAFMRGWHPAHPTFYARRCCFSDFGPFRTDLAISADFELMLRFLEVHKCKSLYIPGRMVRMSLGGASTGSLGNMLDGNRNVMKAFALNGLKCPRLYPVYRLLPKMWQIVADYLKGVFQRRKSFKRRSFQRSYG